jgi:digeranylgeranylglycerophospholipid reductase
MQENCDVLVVGGGPAGLSAAAAAARGGARTVVLERHKEIGYPIHTSGGTWISDMRELKIPENLYHPVNSIVILSPNREVQAQHSGICLLDIRGLYQFLAERAVAAGAQLRLRHSAHRTITEGDQVVGVTAKDSAGQLTEIRAAVTIDAGGYQRRVSLGAGLGKPFHRYGFGAEYDMYAPNFPEHTLYMVQNELTPKGYGWLASRGGGRVRVGVGLIHPDTKDDPREYLDQLIRMPQLGKMFVGASPVEYHTGLIPVAPPLKKMSKAGLLCVGDAAAQASTLVGEGIRFSMHSGIMAGEVAAKAVAAKNVSGEFLADYDRRWRARYGRAMDWSYWVNEHVLSRLENDDYDRLVDLLGKTQRGGHTSALLRGEVSATSVARFALTHGRGLARVALSVARKQRQSQQREAVASQQPPSLDEH